MAGLTARLAAGTAGPAAGPAPQDRAQITGQLRRSNRVLAVHPAAAEAAAEAAAVPAVPAGAAASAAGAQHRIRRERPPPALGAAAARARCRQLLLVLARRARRQGLLARLDIGTTHPAPRRPLRPGRVRGGRHQRPTQAAGRGIGHAGTTTATAIAASTSYMRQLLPIMVVRVHHMFSRLLVLCPLVKEDRLVVPRSRRHVEVSTAELRATPPPLPSRLFLRNFGN